MKSNIEPPLYALVVFKISINIKIISSARRESTTFLFFHIDDVTFQFGIK